MNSSDFNQLFYDKWDDEGQPNIEVVAVRDDVFMAYGVKGVRFEDDASEGPRMVIELED